MLAGRKVKIDTWEDLKDQIGGAYGEKVVIGTEGTPFSLDAAIAALTVDDEGRESWIANDNEEQPGSAIGLLKKIAALKGDQFDQSRYDEGEDGLGYPIDYEPPKKPSPFSFAA